MISKNRSTSHKILHRIKQKGGGSMSAGNILGMLGGLGGGLGSLGNLGSLAGLVGLGGGGLAGLGGLAGAGSMGNGGGMDLSALGNMMSMMQQMRPAGNPPPPEEDAPIVDVEPEPVPEDEEQQESPQEKAPPKQKSAPKSSSREKKPGLDPEQLLGILSLLGNIVPQQQPNPAYQQEWPQGGPGDWASGTSQDAETWEAGTGYAPAAEGQTGDDPGQSQSWTAEENTCSSPCGYDCQNCTLACPRSGLLLPAYQEVRRRAGSWNRY